LEPPNISQDRTRKTKASIHKAKTKIVAEIDFAILLGHGIEWWAWVDLNH
jgi:hypothetical protein